MKAALSPDLTHFIPSQLPFCLLADHRTRSIVLAIRGSLSMRDVFTDLVADADSFSAPCFPAGTTAHRGMIAGARQLLRRLQDGHLLERAFATLPDYQLVLTGHSLGAGVGILLGALLRPRYADLRVYAFGTPAGLLSREAAQCTESYAFSVGVGDDFVMRLSVNSIENLRTSVLETIRACRWPKWRIMLNGMGYAFFGVPSRDLEKTWRDVSAGDGGEDVEQQAGEQLQRPSNGVTEMAPHVQGAKGREFDPEGLAEMAEAEPIQTIENLMVSLMEERAE